MSKSDAGWDSSLVMNTESTGTVSLLFDFLFHHILFLLIIRTKTSKYIVVMRITGNSLVWDAGTEHFTCDWLIIRIIFDQFSVKGSISSSTRYFTTMWHCLSTEPPEVEEVLKSASDVEAELFTECNVCQFTAVQKTAWSKFNSFHSKKKK